MYVYIYNTIIYMYYSMILRRSPQVHYRHAALMNWALLTVSAGTVLMLLLWGTRPGR